MSASTIHKSIFINAPREKVWAFLVDKDKLGQWYHPAEEHLDLNKEYRLFEQDSASSKPIIWGKVLQMQSPGLLITTFNITPFNGNETTIHWELESVEDGTRLSITHEGIAEAIEGSPITMLMALDKGWDNHFADLRQQF